MNYKKPVYLLAGRRRQYRSTPDPFIQRAYHECGKISPTIAYIGTANDDADGFFNRMAEVLR